MFDRIKNDRYLIIRQGQPAPSASNVAGKGEVVGNVSVFFDRSSGEVQLIDAGGASQSIAGKGVVAVSEFSELFAVTEDVGLARGSRLSNVVIYDAGGKAIGKLNRPMSLYETLKLDLAYREPLERFRFGPEGTLYQLMVLQEGIFVTEWSGPE